MANYCGECGAKQKSESVAICTKCGANPKKVIGFCTDCGQKVKSKNAEACLNCGAVFKAKKDPGMAALISAVGGLLLGAPAIGYFYLDRVKKGIAWLVLGWIIVGLSVFSGFLCLVPFLIIPLFYVVVIWDVYLEAKGEKPKLPDIWEE
jgi:hypothetical protein